MLNSTRQAERALERITQQVEDRSYLSAKLPKEWGGADVLITDRPAIVHFDLDVPVDSVSKPGGFYPEPRTVVTKSAPALAWLFNQLRNAFVGLIDGTTKIEFFGRLANAALRYQRKLAGAPEDESSLLTAVVYEARVILEEMEHGEFKYLGFAVGNEIYDDYVGDAERGGYLSTDGTKSFLERQGKKHGDA